MRGFRGELEASVTGRGEEAQSLTESLRRGELLWQERLNEALHRVSQLEQARMEEASRHDALVTQLKLELSETVPQHLIYLIVL